MDYPALIDTEEELEDAMTVPPPALVEMMKRLAGDIVILGIGGKMGITLGREAVRACAEAGVSKQVIGVSRFSDAAAREKVEAAGLQTIACDLLDREAVAKLPQAENVIFMAGRKFGTTDSEGLTWAMNTQVPGNVGAHFAGARTVVFSTGNVYPLSPVIAGGCDESQAVAPLGEYAQSCLGRERVFAYCASRYETPMVMFRLNYAIDLRYGVLHEIGSKVWAGQPVDLAMGHANVIWQGDANTQALRCLEHCTNPPNIVNVTGPETVSVRYVAETFGRLLEKEPVLVGAEAPNALLSNSAKATRLFGYPRVSLLQLIEWQAHWLKVGGATLNKPSHFEVRDGKF
jgi:hypothetical protein